jgi:hypothetical protein
MLRMLHFAEPTPPTDALIVGGAGCRTGVRFISVPAGILITPSRFIEILVLLRNLFKIDPRNSMRQNCVLVAFHKNVKSRFVQLCCPNILNATT